jgi:hypothetical protein
MARKQGPDKAVAAPLPAAGQSKFSAEDPSDLNLSDFSVLRVLDDSGRGT